MNRKSNSFHLDIRTDRKNPYGLLRGSYREDNKVKKETICCISGLSLDQLKMMQAAIQGNVIRKDEFKIIDSREYGASFVCIALLKSLGLHSMIFSRHSEEWVKCCLALITGRLVYAGSKLSLSHCGSYSALWESCGINGVVDVDDHCYDVMDRLLERQEAIQSKLASKHMSNGALVLYDITSCYMEGEYENSELVEYGYNRDQKRGHEQIVISLLCAKDGCPVAVEVLKGNTKDETTVLDKIEEIKVKYGIEKIIFVGDRGMVTQAKYEQINHELVKVISALNHSTINTLCEKKVIQLGLFDEKNIVEVIDGDMRYCLCKNPVMAIKEGKARQALLRKTTEGLDKIIASKRKTKNSKAVRAGKIVNKYKMAKFIIFEGEDDNLQYTLDDAKMMREASLDGCYVIFTDVSPEDITAVDAVNSYKSLIKVEQAFRNLKTVQLEIRPVFHKTDNRIKCHIFICMLAYYIMWHMRQRLLPLTEIDGVGKDRIYSFDHVMECLKTIRKNDVQFLDAKTSVITTPNDEQAYILDLLGVAV